MRNRELGPAFRDLRLCCLNLAVRAVKIFGLAEALMVRADTTIRMLCAIMDSSEGSARDSRV